MTTESSATRVARTAAARQKPTAAPEPNNQSVSLEIPLKIIEAWANIATGVHNGQLRTENIDAEAEWRKNAAQFAYDLLGEMLSRRSRGSVVMEKTQITSDRGESKFQSTRSSVALLRLASGEAVIGKRDNDTFKVKGSAKDIVSIIFISKNAPQFVIGCPTPAPPQTSTIS